MKKLTYLILWMLTAYPLQAQDLSFSQYHYTPFLSNPALIGSDNHLNVFANFRQQPIPDGQSILTPMVSADYPLLSAKSGKRWGGVGLTLINDQAGDLVNTSAIAAAFAYNLSLGKSQLSFALQAGYFNRSVDAGQLLTNSQYVGGVLNPGLPSGENLEQGQAGFFNTGAGILWYKPTAHQRKQAFLGLATNNFLSPEAQIAEAYLAQIPAYTTAIGGLNLMPETAPWIIMPNFRYTYFRANHQANLGSWLRRKTGDDPQTSLGAGLWYNTNQSLIASLEWEQPSWLFAISYDFSLNSSTQVWQRNGTLEITLGFRNLIKGKCPDADQDGVCDAEDQCPNQAGYAMTRGCPDQDADDTADQDDACPDTPGKPLLQGCPDQDNDNIADHEDDCPQIAGPAALKGCPDSDGDGLADPKDQCPDQPGSIANQGCPEQPSNLEEEIAPEEAEILEKASHVQFETGKAIIRTLSYPLLNEVVRLMQNHPNGSLTLIGHTDNTGNPADNLLLSKQRADAVKDYFISQGIDAQRISTGGKGDTQPIQPNSTEEGRQANRRVQMIFRSR